MLVPLDRDSPVPVLRQLYLGLRRAILTGAVPSGGRLPPTRALADRLGVARNTVVAAYEQLLAEGFIEGRVGAGSFVSRALPEAPTPPPPVDSAPPPPAPPASRRFAGAQAHAGLVGTAPGVSRAAGEDAAALHSALSRFQADSGLVATGNPSFGTMLVLAQSPDAPPLPGAPAQGGGGGSQSHRLGPWDRRAEDRAGRVWLAPAAPRIRSLRPEEPACSGVGALSVIGTCPEGSIVIVSFLPDSLWRLPARFSGLSRASTHPIAGNVNVVP